MKMQKKIIQNIKINTENQGNKNKKSDLFLWAFLVLFGVDIFKAG